MDIAVYRQIVIRGYVSDIVYVLKGGGCSERGEIMSELSESISRRLKDRMS